MTLTQFLSFASKGSDDLGGWVISAALFLATLAWWPGLIAGQLPKWMVLYAFCLALPFLRFQWDAVTASVLLFLGWLCLSVLWSEDQRQSLHQLHKLLPLAACFFAGRVYGLKPVIRVAGLCVAGVLAFELIFGWFGSFGNENFATEYVVLLLPLLWLGSNSEHKWVRIAHLGVLGACLVYLMHLPSRIEFVAFYGLFLFILWRYARSAVVFAVAVPVLILFVVPEAWDVVKASAQARIELWWNTGHMVLEHPLIGQGFGSFNYHYPRFGMEHLALFDRVEVQIGHHAGAAHNDYLQLWAETGLVGLGLAGLCLWVIFSRSVPSVILILGAVMCAIGFPAQMPVTGALLAYALGSCCPLSFWRTAGWDLKNGGGMSRSEAPTLSWWRNRQTRYN
jgi:O-antigen ligase